MTNQTKHRLTLLATFAAFILGGCTSVSDQSPSRPAAGPLRVHPGNPRYFTDGTTHADGSLRAVYLTGAHTWNNLFDIGPGDPPPAFDYPAHLDFLQRHHHNFFRLWMEEEMEWVIEQKDKPTVRNIMTPLPWARTGPGLARDGKPKFDLRQFNPAFFARLRSRLQDAGRRGIYVAVMLFEGWIQQQKGPRWKDHPFHPDNNVNGIDGDANGDGIGTDVHTLANPAVTRVQEAFVRHVIDTVGDLDNVLYEIANECGSYSTEWQYHLIRFIKAYEATKPKQHPVGMTFQWSPNSKLRGTNQILFDSPADWISPNRVAGEWNYRDNPPPADGRKVIVPDTDHLGGIWGNVAWVWKSFTRGHNPIFMDPYDGSVLAEGGSPAWAAVRSSMGVASQLARRVNLGAMTPQGALASSGYCLAATGREYIVYLPTGGEVSVDLSAAAGSLQVEWLDPRQGNVTAGEDVSGGARRSFKSPFAGDAVLHLKAR
ncbi:MAG: hypothetical protein HZA93_12095 [Verrucomicrobia bacterium]|nr:hypothetical protein [Verrucomicrobiota bacterium]